MRKASFLPKLSQEWMFRINRPMSVRFDISCLLGSFSVAEQPSCLTMKPFAVVFVFCLVLALVWADDLAHGASKSKGYGGGGGGYGGGGYGGGGYGGGGYGGGGYGGGGYGGGGHGGGGYGGGGHGGGGYGGQGGYGGGGHGGGCGGGHGGYGR